MKGQKQEIQTLLDMVTNELTLEGKLDWKQEQISNIIAYEFNRHNQIETE